MASIASKNLYELLGNDPELDPDREPEPPTKAVDKPVNRIGKRDGPTEAPSRSTGTERGVDNTARRNGPTGSERAFNDRSAGANENRRRAPDDGLRQDRHPDRIRADRGEYRGKSRGRGGGMARGGARIDDRRSKTGIVDHEKQLAHGWGGNTAGAELDDEKAGDAIAKEEEKDGFDTNVPPPVDGEGNVLPDAAGNGAAEDSTPAEPEGPKAKSYEEYQAELAEKKAALGAELSIRKPNEGASKKFPDGKAFERDDTQENFFIGGAEKKTRERTKKEKQLLELDSAAMRPQEEPRSSRGGRGGPRGGRGGDRGGDRPERREPREPREPREGGETRGRGGRGRGEGRPRGEFRGNRGRGGSGPAGPNISDSNAFPSLGA